MVFSVKTDAVVLDNWINSSNNRNMQIQGIVHDKLHDLHLPGSCTDDYSCLSLHNAQNPDHVLLRLSQIFACTVV